MGRVRSVNTITSKKKIVSSSLRIRKAEEFSTFYYYTKQQLKKKDNCREREKYNQIKIRRPSETLCENFKHYEYEKKKVKNNYSRVRKRRPRKILLLSHKKKTSSFHFEIQKYLWIKKERK